MHTANLAKHWTAHGDFVCRFFHRVHAKATLVYTGITLQLITVSNIVYFLQLLFYAVLSPF